jgi:hypothetical protein
MPKYCVGETLKLSCKYEYPVVPMGLNEAVGTLPLILNVGMPSFLITTFTFCSLIAFFGEKLGFQYPWNKYAQVVVRDYVSGAMENTSATLHGDFVQKNFSKKRFFRGSLPVFTRPAMSSKYHLLNHLVQLFAITQDFVFSGG